MKLNNYIIYILLILIILSYSSLAGCREHPSNSEAEGFSFVFMSDTQADPQTGDYTAWGQLLKQATEHESQPAFIMVGGDLVNDGSDQEEWEDFFTAGGETLDKFRVYPAMGNHDDSELYTSIFDLPDNGPEGKEEAFYSFDYGNAHFTVMDSNAMGAAEQEDIDWLRKDLSNTNKTCKIVMFHHPAYPAVEIPKDIVRAETLRKAFVPVMEEGGVDLVLTGHQHVYMRTYSLLNGIRDEDGIIYLMGTSGGKQYTPSLFDYTACSYSDKPVYSIVYVDKQGISIETRDSAGIVVDSTRVSISEEQRDISLVVRGDGINGEHKFTLQELSALPNSGFQHVYSTINNWPTPRFYAAKGISLYSILKAAGVLNTFKLITFRSPDGYEVSFTREQLLDTRRYYYPCVNEGRADEAEPVEPIIAYAYKEGSADLGNVLPDVLCLIIGQSSPEEHTNPAFVVNVSEIIISNKEAQTWDAATTFPLEGKIPSGESVKLQHKHYGLVKLYYTLDGKDPTEQSSMYNVSTFQPELNVPITITEDTIIKVLVTGYGKKNSPISSFKFEVQ